MSTPWARLWAELNERQHFYLQAVYELDQQNEDYYKRQWNVYTRGYPPPASQWRWLLYGPTDPPSPLYTKIQKAGFVDPGTGSTFEALASRGYIEKRYQKDPTFPDLSILSVQITPKGRALIRNNDPAYQPKPNQIKGQLTESQWRCLKILYEAGETGVESNGSGYGYGPTKMAWPTLLRLRDYKPQALMQEKNYHEQQERDWGVWNPSRRGEKYKEMVTRYFVQITAYGKAYYEANREYYEGLYGKGKG